MSRHEARARWEALANAEFDRESLLWLANVAGEIVKADKQPDDNRRRSAITAAVGLFGPLETERETIRAVVMAVDHDCTLTERGSRWCAPRKLARGERSGRRREAVAAVLGVVEGPDAIDKRIKRALAR